MIGGLETQGGEPWNRRLQGLGRYYWILREGSLIGCSKEEQVTFVFVEERKEFIQVSSP